MTERAEISGVLRHWFDDGPSTMPDRVVDVVADRIGRQPQRRAVRVGPGARPSAHAGLGVAAAVGLLLIALVTLAVIGGSQPVVPRILPADFPTASASPTDLATLLPEPSRGIGRGRIVLEFANTTMPNQLRYLAQDGSALPLLADFGGHQRTATWQPDGQRFAFAGRPDGHPDEWLDVYEAEPDGTSVRLLSTDCEPPACVEETDPAYSPDGNRVVVVRRADLRGDEPTRSVLAVYDIRAGRATEIAATSFPYATHEIGHPRWSPDGAQIVFHVVEGPPSERRQLIFPEPTSPGPSSLYVVGADGSGLRQLTPDGVSAGDPDWSPDGSLIVFGPTSLHLWLYGQNQAAWRIQTIRPDGTDLRVTVPGTDAATPSWTAGGGQILFTQQDVARQVIRIADSDGSDVRDVATFPSTGEIEMYPVQQPMP
jgi:Tol biopolymer transport system component